LPFLKRIQNKDTLKILIGNSSLKPVANKLNCVHIEIPKINCYSKIDDITKQVTDLLYKHTNVKHDISLENPITNDNILEKAIVIVCASMASEAIIYRLLQYDPQHQYIDLGSVFDAFVGIRSRGYTKNDKNFRKIQEVYGAWLNE